MNDIIQTIIFGVILLLVVMFIVGYSEVLHPEAPEEHEVTGCVFPCEFPAPVYHLAVESLKYQTRGK